MRDWKVEDLLNIKQIITGGESGNKKGIRPIHPEWATDAQAAAKAAGVKWFFKQWGEYVPVTLEDAKDGDMVVYEHSGFSFPWYEGYPDNGGQVMARVGKKAAGRVFNDDTFNELAWHK